MVHAINHSGPIEAARKHIVLRPPRLRPLSKTFLTVSGWPNWFRGIAQRLVVEDASSARLQSTLGVFCLRREATNGSRFVAARQQVAKRSMAETLGAASHLHAAAVQQSVKPWRVGTAGPFTVFQENVQ